jgi:hypothetical protein
MDFEVILLGVASNCNYAFAKQAWTCPEGSRRLKLPEFLDSRHMKVVRLMALCNDHLYVTGDTTGSPFC